MACNQRSPTTVKFFKIICQENLRDEKIQLPVKFTRKYERVLSNPVLLKVSDGAEWRVHWEKHEGKVELERGWKEFAQNYYLDRGHILIFKYEVASSKFAVEIFDESTLEIDYPLRRSANDDRARAHNLQNLENVKVEEVVDLEDDDSSSHQVEVQEDIAQSGMIPRTKKNPCFRVEMRKSYITGRCIAIPEKFAKKYLKQGPVCLKVLGVGTWRVEFKVWERDNIRKYKLQRGWSKFTRGNNLQVGEVCVFELINSTEATFTVTFSRVVR